MPVLCSLTPDAEALCLTYHPLTCAPPWRADSG